MAAGTETGVLLKSAMAAGTKTGVLLESAMAAGIKTVVLLKSAMADGTEKKKIQELLPAFEKANGWAPGSLSLTGNTAKGADHAKLYELKSSAEESIWVKVEKDKLVKVPAPTKGITTSKAKPKSEKTRLHGRHFSSNRKHLYPAFSFGPDGSHAELPGLLLATQGAEIWTCR